MFDALPLRPGLAPMEAKLVAAIPDDSGWRFEPKWDGFRCLAFRDGANIALMSKSGKPLDRYFPEVVALLASVPAQRFVVDGELITRLAGRIAFDALQMRLHPAASRIAKLSAETPAELMLFDMLVDANGDDLSGQPFGARRSALEAFVDAIARPEIHISPQVEDVAQAREWLNGAGGDLDGVVAKRADAPYAPGERAMLKIKRLRSADCVVGGFRYAEGKPQVGSLLLGLYDDAGLLHHVGFTSSLPGDRAELTAQLKALVEAPGFTGSAPGGPSRWSTERSSEWQPLRPELVAEVRYDHVTGDRFRHGTKFLRWRPDKAPADCTLAQLRAEAAVVLSEGSTASRAQTGR